MKDKRKIIRMIIIGAEIIYLFVFYSQNFAIIFPGKPMAWGYKVFAAVFSLSNFCVCLLLIRAGLLQKKDAKALFWISIAFLSIYLFSGIQILLKMHKRLTINGFERIKSFLLCIAEIVYRTACIKIAD